MGEPYEKLEFQRLRSRALPVASNAPAQGGHCELSRPASVGAPGQVAFALGGPDQVGTHGSGLALDLGDEVLVSPMTQVELRNPLR